MIDHALHLAGHGWRVFPCHTTIGGACSCGRDCGKDAGKHPRIKAWQKAATTDPQQITRWWTRWPDANVAIATGSGLIVLDIDGAENLATLARLKAEHGPLPQTLTASTGRGLHLYFAGHLPNSRMVDRLLLRGEGGFVIAPPSFHANGKRYQWVQNVPLCNAPEWLLSFFNTPHEGSYTLNAPTALGALPDYLKKQNQKSTQIVTADSSSVTARAAAAMRTPWSGAEQARIEQALSSIPASCDRDTWLHLGMALHDLQWSSGPEGGDLGFLIWQAWSETGGDKYQGLHDLETRWKSFGKPGRGGVTLGTLFHTAEQHGWKGSAPRAAPVNGKLNGHPVTSAALDSSALPIELTTPSPGTESPLFELNKKYAVIGDVGSKCLVLGWVPSKVDETIQVPSFQAFRSFSERYASQYVMVQKPKGDDWTEEPAQLGATWLKWRKRRSYEGIDLVPGGPPSLPGNVLNLWNGYAIEPKQGPWPLMQAHIANVLASGDRPSLEYIMKWAAWSVQNPGDRAETALVFRGDKGSGKGTFANALKRMFGQHGLQIFNSKHLVGAFNGHLRNCLLLFADEAFWAGDKQGESVLKGMLTEPALMIEQKGVDAAPWKNRLHVIMAANSKWVVPASHDERRYAVFDVSNEHKTNKRYFNALQHEIQNGGLGAMLWDLQHAKLGSWHPREVVQTAALQRQKERSLDPCHEWWEDILQNGRLPLQNDEMVIAAGTMIGIARDSTPRLKDMSTNALGRFLREVGFIQIHRAQGNFWKVPELKEARGKWSEKFGAWDWRLPAELWNEKRF